MQPFVHADDIDVNEEQDCRDLDRLARGVLSSANVVVKGRCKNQDLAHFLIDALYLFEQTHGSIRLLCRDYLQTTGQVGDALSLVREQVEKVFVVALVLHDSSQWLVVWQKQLWESEYRHFLIDSQELAQLDRWKQVVRSQGARLDEMRSVLGITDSEARTIEANVKQNAGMHFHFPTPYKIKCEIVRCPDRKKYLSHWYNEYVWYSGFGHALAEKAFLARAQRDLAREDLMLRKEFLGKRLDPGLTASWASIASVGLDIYSHFGSAIELLEPLDKLWGELRRGTLVGRKLWEVRAKHVLPTDLSGL